MYAFNFDSDEIKPDGFEENPGQGNSRMGFYQLKLSDMAKVTCEAINEE